MRAPDGRRFLAAFHPWSSPADDARLRRPTDVLLLAGSLLVCAVIGVALRTHPPAPAAPPARLDLVDLATWACDAAYALVGVWALMLAVLPLLSRGRRRLLLDYLLAAVLSLALGLLVARPLESGLADSVHALLTGQPSPVDIVGPLAIATSVVVVASPHLARPLRWTGRLLVAVGAVAAVVLGLTHPSGAPGAVAVGIAAAAAVHLALGTPSGRPTAAHVAESLPDVGVDVDALEPDPRQRPGASTFRGRADGRAVLVTVYGRDAWDDQVVGSVWTALTVRGETVQLLGGRRHRVEHEALVTLLAEREGVPVLPVVAAGVADDGNALLVTDAPAARLLDVGDDVDDADLAGQWDALLRLHGLGIAHRGVDRGTVVRRTDGTWALTELDDARLAADPTALQVDRVRLLVATAVAVGHERAVTAATTALGAAGMAELLPCLQSAVLDRAARRAVGATAWSLEDLRGAAVEAAGVEPPPLLQVRRVTAKSVGIVLVVGLMAYTLVGMLSGVDLATVRQELSDADGVWLWVALALSPVVQVGFAFSTLGASTAQLRFVPVLMLEYAIQFIALTLPSTAARLALTVRFFQRFGIPPGSAVSMGVIDSVSGFVVQVALLLVILLSGLPGFTSPLRPGQSTGSSTSDGSSPSLLGLLALLVVVGAAVTLLVPRLRRRALGRIPALRESLVAQTRTARSSLVVLRHPGKVATMLLGNLWAQVVQAVILGVCLYAFGQTAHLSQLILINTAVSLFAGLMPVPGGMGVAEAGYTAGLQAIGVPSSVAMSVAIAFRLVTFYLPPLWGSVAMRWLRRRQYV